MYVVKAPPEPVATAELSGITCLSLRKRFSDSHLHCTFDSFLRRFPSLAVLEVGPDSNFESRAFDRGSKPPAAPSLALEPILKSLIAPQGDGDVSLYCGPHLEHLVIEGVYIITDIFALLAKCLETRQTQQSSPKLRVSLKDCWYTRATDAELRAEFQLNGRHSPVAPAKSLKEMLVEGKQIDLVGMRALQERFRTLADAE